MRLAPLIALSMSCSHRPPREPAPEPAPIERQKALAAEPGREQTLHAVRLASMALAGGDTETAEQALRQAVARMQDFRAEGEFRAMIASEDRKEWKGDPYEKMMAFLYLGLLLLEDDEAGNALAMSKSAILADTGTNQFRYRSDFVPAFVLQALVYEQLGEDENARRSMQQAVDAIYVREVTQHLSDRLMEAEPASGDRPYDGDALDAARVLLLSALPAGVAARPRDLDEALSATLSRATDLRMLVLDASRDDRPEDLQRLEKGAVRDSLRAFEPLVAAWRDEVAAEPVQADLDATAAALEAVVERPPRLVLVVEEGTGPRKVSDGRYGEILRIQPRGGSEAPEVRLDGQGLDATYLDSVTWQATTRGSRAVDGFLRGKAVFKDAAPFLGWALLVSGDVARALQENGDEGTVGTVLYVLGLATWVAGAATNPEADTRAWLELPDTLWLVAADPEPGTHALEIDGRRYEVDVPADGTAVHLIPALDPGNRTLGGDP